MSNSYTVRCGDKEATIEIIRPNFDDVKKAYEKIDKIGQEEATSKYTEYLKATGDQEEANHIYALVLAEKRYEILGEQAYKEFMSNKDGYINTCALRMSYALNYSVTHPIKNMKKQVKDARGNDRGYKGIDGHIYYLGVPDIIELLNKNWKKSSLKTYSQVKEKIQSGRSKDFYHNMTSKAENQKFFKELQSIKRKGVVAMRGPSGFNHTTLWEVNNFVDVELDTSDNYLLRNDVLIREFYFWSLL